jgi:hypothetical protein
VSAALCWFTLFALASAVGEWPVHAEYMAVLHAHKPCLDPKFSVEKVHIFPAADYVLWSIQDGNARHYCTVLCKRCPLHPCNIICHLTFHQHWHATCPAARPEALIPLMKGCRRVVLVGDHKHLPPVVKSSEAAAGGLGQSLFEQLMGIGAPSAMLQVRTSPAGPACNGSCCCTLPACLSVQPPPTHQHQLLPRPAMLPCVA